MRTNIKGDIGELIVMTKLLKNGYWVSKPFGDDCPYDILADNKEGKIIRIQVKYVTPKDDLLRCKLFSNTGVSYKDSVDWILIVNSDTESVYKLDLSEFDSETAIYLRLTQPKNNQTKGVRLAESYLIN